MYSSFNKAVAIYAAVPTNIKPFGRIFGEPNHWVRLSLLFCVKSSGQRSNKSGGLLSYWGSLPVEILWYNVAQMVFFISST